jgi:putative ABC transport system permease protein
MEALWRDIRNGARALIRAPGFTVVATVTLALGIGATAAEFTVFNSLHLNPVPWENPGSIVAVLESNLRQDSSRRGVATAKYVEWREQTQSFEGLVGARWSSFNLTEPDQLDVLEGAQATPNAFPVLGIRPFLGRGFLSEEAEPGAAPVAMLSYRTWHLRFGGDPAIVGRAIDIDGHPVTVVGVFSDRQWFPWASAELVTPLRLSAEDLSRTDHTLDVYARLAPGVSMVQAQSEMDVVVRRLADEYPETDADWTARVLPLSELFTAPATRNASLVSMVAFFLVLLIACGNVANLQLARGAARQKEIAIRSAIGASRGQIVRQLLIESVLLALLALPLSFLVMGWFMDWLISLVPVDNLATTLQVIKVDTAVLVFLGVTSFATVLVFGLAPALKASRTDLVSGLKQGGERGSRGAGGQRLRSSLVVVQIALSLALLISAGLLIQWSIRLRSIDAGFPTENLLTTFLELPEQRYPEEDHWKTFQRELLAGIEALPGVRSASAAASPPFGWSPRRDFTIRGRPLGPQDAAPMARWSNVSPGYFDTLGLRRLQGRGFLESDRESSVPVVIVNESLASRYFGEEGAVGEHLVFAGGEAREIVGVVGDISEDRASAFTDLQLYEPYAQRPTAEMGIVIRTEGPPLSLAMALRRAVLSRDPLLPVVTMQSMSQRVEGSLWISGVMTSVLTTLAGLALLLTIVGVYGVVNYATSRRISEFGIRAALGASPGTIAGLVLRQAAVLAAWGVSIGLLLALGLTRLLAAAMYNLEAFEPATLLGLSLLLLGVTLAASTLPAFRATRADPMLALQGE